VEVSKMKIDLAKLKTGVRTVTTARASTAVSVPQLDSLITTQFPPLFQEFRAKQWQLLWRGSRDGFGAADFHCRCDGHANTLTFILDTEGNVFGGFTSVKWKSARYDEFTGDGSLQSFLFTFKNPHSIPARRFALRDEQKHCAICCNSRYGPAFGGGDIYISDNCTTNSNSYTSLGTRSGGRTYTNDTSVKELFTGAHNVRVKEIEVFEIIGYASNCCTQNPKESRIRVSFK
jgi:hypothetical protein